MGLKHIDGGSRIPDEFNVVIEIPMRAEPVKYEVEKKSGVLHVDRFLSTAMFYPTNYGYVPQTLSEDGDPVDVLVVTPVPLLSGSVITCRAVGMLKMTDESGVDAKILAVPISKLTKLYENIHSYADLPEPLLQSLEHFFTHYKDLEKGKWVKVDGWEGIDAAKNEIIASVTRCRELIHS
ncbi:MAG: inorganic diphosphatase [Gammaproteobacteria bacterium]|nr:inorganic diphosphatase [Gammaproteobacteria bacterium]